MVAQEMSRENLRYIRIHGSKVAPFRWIRTENSKYDDILTGHYRNEYLGWYKEASDPNSQSRALDDLRQQGIKWRDFAKQ